MKRFFFRLVGLFLSAGLMLTSASALTVEQAAKLIQTHHINGLPAGAEQAQSIEELLALVGDKYTSYFDPEAYAAFLDTLTDEKLIGIGVSILPHEEGLYISSVIDDSPASDAGLGTDDIILAINGVTIRTTEEATAVLSGEAGESVHLTVRKADGTVVELDLVRREFVVPTTGSYYVTEDGNAGVIVSTAFGDRTAYHFRDAIREHDAGVNAWIVDLSANIGGTTTSSAGSAGQFIGSAIMVYMRDAADEYTFTYTMPTVKPETEKPAIVLTSKYTASGAELFTGDIRDHGAGIAIGQRTTGKGVAQIVFDKDSYPDLFTDDAMKITTYRFFSPVGTTNDQGGVIPTLLISPENAYAAALLLCADEPEPEQFADHLNITLCDRELYIHLPTALSADYRPALVELLEALPATAQLWMDEGANRWKRTDMSTVIERLGLTEYKARTFTDVAGHKYLDSINTMATYRLINGYGDGQFRPDNTITRAEFCALIANTIGLSYSPAPKDPVYYDLSPQDWYYAPVIAMTQAGYVSGYSDGSFSPNQTITQEELIHILAQVGAWLNMRIYDQAKEEPSDAESAAYLSYSPWARHGAWLLDVSGVELGDVVPDQRATRAQAADLLCQLLTQIKYLWPATYETDET